MTAVPLPMVRLFGGPLTGRLVTALPHSPLLVIDTAAGVEHRYVVTRDTRGRALLAQFSDSRPLFGETAR